METKNEDHMKEYKKLRNKVRMETRKTARKEYDLIATTSKENPKKFWNHVNSKRKAAPSIGDLKNKLADGSVEVIRDDKDKAEAFSEYFASVYTDEGLGHFDKMEPKDCTDNGTVTFHLHDIQKRLSNLKVAKSPGCDVIHPRILKELSFDLAQPLKIIFEHSFEQKRLPSDWLSADITVIYKKGSKAELSNYRPISLTCVCCKIMESVIRDHIMNYFIENNLFSSRQFGFITGHSTVMQLLTILDNWTMNLEAGGQIDVIYTDFEKAFNKVPHERLISKLISYGINMDVIHWIKAFLNDRRQRIKVNGKFSKWQKVYSGIPQGSILGPILFIIFINDIVHSCTNTSELYLYADDAKLFRCIHTDCDNIKLQEDLNNVKRWADNWLLKLNIN
jgi:hypothetical protein